MSTITERTERGAALLDARRPGWWQRIDLDRLDLSDTCDCVAGQISGGVYITDWTLAMEALGLETPALQAAHGFDATDGDGDRAYDALTAAWRDLIGQRQACAGVAA